MFPAGHFIQGVCVKDCALKYGRNCARSGRSGSGRWKVRPPSYILGAAGVRRGDLVRGPHKASVRISVSLEVNEIEQSAHRGGDDIEVGGGPGGGDVAGSPGVAGFDTDSEKVARQENFETWHGPRRVARLCVLMPLPFVTMMAGQSEGRPVSEC